MADLDLNALLPANWSHPYITREQGLAVLTSLQNQLYQNPENSLQTKSQIEELFGPQVSQQIISNALPTIGGTQVTTQQGAGAPTVTPLSDLYSQQDAASQQNQAFNPRIISDQPNPLTDLTPPGNGTGGLYNVGTTPAFGSPITDVERILSEAALQRKDSLSLLDQQNSSRQKYLTDLSGILQKQQAQQLTTELPGMYEDLNSRGLLRSSALGDKLSLRQEDLAKITSSQLAQQGLAYNDQYTSGLGDIENNYFNARNTGLQRQFSIEDLNTNIEASKELGFALQPAPASSGNTKGSSTLSGGLTGAMIGSKFGPAGAVIGAGGGAVAGSASSGK